MEQSRAFGFLLLSLVVVSGSQVRYDGHKVLRLDVDSSNALHVSGIASLHEQFNVDFWEDVDIRVSPDQQDSVLSFLESHNISYSVMVNNVQELIDAESAVHESFRSSPNADWFSDYHDLDEINDFIQQLQKNYPELVTIETVGLSYEGRASYAVTVRSKNTSGKIGLFFEGGIHSREWIAHATVLWILNQLVTQYGKDSTTTKLVDQIEWTIVPVVNTDGYVYTWTTDRMWRKTRTPNSGSTCIGVDPNRNWDNHWCQIGASKDPCSDSYCGPRAFSDPCVKNVANFIQNQRNNTKGFIDFHSYSQLWMNPYGWTSSPPKDYAAQVELAKEATDALYAKHGISYSVGSIYTTVYPASGSSADWAYDTCGIKFPYGVELRDTGAYGFLLPASQIIPSGEETWEAAKVMAQYILDHSD